jgi:threonine synthase
MSHYSLRCADCSHSTPEDRYYVGCPRCNGFLEVELSSVPASPVDDRFPSIFKYHPVMPYDPANDVIVEFENISPTPVVFADRLSDRLGIEVHFKDETAMPSGTWKDREGFVSIHRLLKNGIDDLVVFSSGNTGTALARSASIVRGPRVHLVVPNASRNRISAYPELFHPDYVKVHFFDGSNDESAAEAGRLAAEMGYQGEGGFANYARREGLKLLALEVMHEWGKPVDWYVQPVAGGIGIYSYHKAYRDLGIAEQCPKILGVQADICAPMVNAWRAGAPALEAEHIPRDVVPSEFVRVLRTRKPTGSYPVVKRVIDTVGGQLEKVSDAEILDGLRLLYLDEYYRDVYRRSQRLAGLEPATALAGVVKGVAAGYIERGARVLVNVSGAAKPGDVKIDWIADLL